jgi:hypothetical protein
MWLALVVCVGCADRLPPQPEEPWVRLPPVELIHAPDLVQLPRDQFAVVEEKWQPEAQAELAAVAYKPITSEQATKWLGRQLAGEGRLVLLRGVCLSLSDKTFDVQCRGESVIVDAGHLGPPPGPVMRKALVARLPVLPNSVYVHLCSAD